MNTENKLLTLHDIFRQISTDFGAESLTETRLKGLLCDYGGAMVNRFSHVIARSISCQIGKKLLSIRELDDADYNLRLSNLRQSFQEENFFRYDIANYIIDCYLFGLELIDKVADYDEEGYTESSSKAGELSFINYSGKEYCGNYNEEKKRSGFGVEKNEECSYYAGEWKLDMKNGIGIEVDSQKQKYAGEWRFNRKAGVGIEITSEGNRYAGEWKNGKRNGSGMVVYPNGEKMCITFSNGLPKEDAVGIYYLKDGSVVVGNMTINGPNGKCCHFLLNGNSIEENWENGIIK
jgi:hypothetical protein